MFEPTCSGSHLLKLKAYLTCFPAKIVVAPKVKPAYNDKETPKRVDQVWLISDGV